MKRALFLIVLSQFTQFIAIGQNKMGLIEVNKDNTATLNFPEEIKFTIIGNNPQISKINDFIKYQYYDIFQEGKSVVLRGNDKSAPRTSITVKLTDGQIWFGEITYGDNPKILYDFSASKSIEVEQIQLKDSLNKRVGEAIITERLNFLMTKEQEYNDLGVEGNNLEFQVTNMMNDEKYTYIKFGIRNNSGSDYQIDNIIFKYVEGKKMGLKKNEAKIEERLNPVLEPSEGDKIINGYSTTQLGYVVPLYTVGAKGSLFIQIIEKKGTRNPIIEIDAKTMLKVKKL